MAGFLLGTVSGSGVATTVTLGSVTWPILRRGGYPKEEGGGVLAASGIGAILSPPTLGAAAFIIAEFLGVSYLTVLVYALIPSVLYYLGIFLAIEADARRFETDEVKVETPPAGKLILRYGYHFSSLFAIVFFLAIGLSPFRVGALRDGARVPALVPRPQAPDDAGARSGRRWRRARGRCCRWRRRARRRGSSSRS